MSTSIHDYTIPIEGLESEHDASIVGNAISRLKGIESYKVEFNNNRAVIRVDNPETVSKAINAIRKFGYEVPLSKKTIPVLEMTCAACATGVENALKKQEGVINASVNYANAQAKVEYFTGMLNLGKAKKNIQKLGYDIVIEEADSDKDSLENLRREKLHRLKIKTYWALALSIPVVIIGMFFMHIPYANEIMWLFTTPVVAWIGRDFYINAWKQTRNGAANMDTLVALSTGVAYAYSVFSTLFPHFWYQKGLDPHVYFEAAAVIIAFILLGKLLEERAKENTSSAIKNLMGLQPKTVRVLQKDDKHIEIPIQDVQVDDIILVKPGEKIAVDGIVKNGESYVDESMLTGEPLAVYKNKDSKVYAGTINQKGSFSFKATKVGIDTILAKIIQMVQDAQGSKAPVQKLVDKIAGVFVPIVVLIALATFITWNVFGSENAFTQGLLAMITVLVIACPCALGLATPTAIMVGVGKAAEKGILIKDAESLELAKNINAIVLDKTGTITEGAPSVTKEWWNDKNPKLKQILYSLERQSEHPLAEAVIRHLESEKAVDISHFESITGMGAKATCDNERYLIGNERLMRENQIPIDENMKEKVAVWTREAHTVIWFANSKSILSILAIEDQIKKSSRDSVLKLQQSGIETHMLTGDNEATAESVARNVGIHYYRAEVLPDQKADYIKKLQSNGKIVAMVGDGINDSAALAQADVSIAMGKGSDIAMDVAKMTIISSDLSKLPEAIKLSKSTVRTIRQNLFWAFIYNLIGIPIAAGLLYPINGFMLNPMLAGAAMALSSVSVVSNSLRLKYS
jgi:P-type Cu2+ transporter